MAKEITITVGDLYGQLHEKYSAAFGEQYDERLRQDVEEFVHRFNQNVERRADAAGESVEDVDFTPDEE